MNDLEQATEVIKQGGIVIFPTDTVYGIGCRVDNENSAEKLFEMRKRPETKAMPVLFESIDQVKKYVLPFEEKIEKLMEKYWPGALTIILPCDKSKIPNIVRGGGSTLGVRIPDHEVALALVRGAGVPIAASSANFSGETTPHSFEGLDKALVKLVDFVLKGETRGQGKASTVIDCSTEPWKIIRQGIISPDL